IGRHRDETACAGCGRASGRDINDDRNWRAEEALHDFLRRIEQTARRVELDHQTLDILRLRFFDASGNVTGCRRPDCTVDVDKANFLPGDNLRRQCAGKPEEQRNNPNGGALAASPGIAFATFRSASQSSVLRKLKLLSWGEA